VTTGRSGERRVFTSVLSRVIAEHSGSPVGHRLLYAETVVPRRPTG